MPENSDVQLAIYTVTGQLVRTLFKGQAAKGTHSIMWDSRDDAGKRVSSGVYVYRIQAGDFTQVRKMVLVR
ncbi:MAG: FlgD immunoglobulin-like domain containing protein [bacterium]